MKKHFYECSTNSKISKVDTTNFESGKTESSEETQQVTRVTHGVKVLPVELPIAWNRG